MTATVRSTRQLHQLAGDLPQRYTGPLAHLQRARVLSGAQLDTLLAVSDEDPQTTARVRRRITARLRDHGLVSCLDRRVGGVRAGSAGHVYTLTSTGHRLLAHLDGRKDQSRARHARAPGPAFLAHALAISDLYVQLVHASRTSPFHVASFLTEPGTWWPVGDGTHLRPDAYAVLKADAHADCWWLEVDNDTESLPRIRAKTRAYLNFLLYGGTGPDDVPPRVLFTAPTQQRASAIATAIIRESEGIGLVVATVHAEAVQKLINELSGS